MRKSSRLVGDPDEDKKRKDEQRRNNEESVFIALISIKKEQLILFVDYVVVRAQDILIRQVVNQLLLKNP